MLILLEVIHFFLQKTNRFSNQCFKVLHTKKWAMLRGYYMYGYYILYILQAAHLRLSFYKTKHTKLKMFIGNTIVN